MATGSDQASIELKVQRIEDLIAHKPQSKMRSRGQLTAHLKLIISVTSSEESAVREWQLRRLPFPY
jgi:hypothetical protein